MVTKIDSLYCGNVLVKKPIEKKVSKNDSVLFKSEPGIVEDIFAPSNSVKKAEKKTSSKKKWLIALGGVATVAVGVAAICFFKNRKKPNFWVQLPSVCQD